MAGISARERINRALRNYRHFDTEDAARAFARAHRLRAFVLSANEAGTCWTLYHPRLWKI